MEAVYSPNTSCILLSPGFSFQQPLGGAERAACEDVAAVDTVDEFEPFARQKRPCAGLRYWFYMFDPVLLP